MKPEYIHRHCAVAVGGGSKTTRRPAGGISSVPQETPRGEPALEGASSGRPSLRAEKAHLSSSPTRLGMYYEPCSDCFYAPKTKLYIIATINNSIFDRMRRRSRTRFSLLARGQGGLQQQQGQVGGVGVEREGWHYEGSDWCQRRRSHRYSCTFYRQYPPRRNRKWI